MAQPHSAIPSNKAASENASSLTSETSPGSRHSSESTLEAGLSLEHRASQQERKRTDAEMSEKAHVTSKDPYLAAWDGQEDPNDPLNWNMTYRWFLTICAGFLCLNASFASSATSGISEDLMKAFHFGEEVATLAMSLFICGYILGPIVWGPLSERIGRKRVLLMSYIPFCGFQIGCALSKNTASFLIFRLLSGTFAAAPFSVCGGIVADLHGPSTRAIAMSIFATAPFAGPALAPIVSGFIAVSGTNWKWMFWVLAIFCGACIAVIVFLVPETYGAYLLTQKARRLRKETGDRGYYSTLERRLGAQTRGEMAKELLLSPLILFFTEPVVFFSCLYSAFVFGVIYLTFEAFPLVYIRDHGWNIGEEGLAFLPLPLGGVAATLATIFYYNPQYRKQVAKAFPEPVSPEARLLCSEHCALAYPVGFLLIAWTSYPYLTPVGPLIGTFIIGFVCVGLFLGMTNYTVDLYLSKAATVLSANVITRSVCGTVFPLFARQLYESKLGVPWATTVLAIAAVLLAPIPFLFHIYGPKLRAMSKYARQ